MLDSNGLEYLAQIRRPLNALTLCRVRGSCTTPHTFNSLYLAAAEQAHGRRFTMRLLFDSLQALGSRKTCEGNDDELDELETVTGSLGDLLTR